MDGKRPVHSSLSSPLVTFDHWHFSIIIAVRRMTLVTNTEMTFTGNEITGQPGIRTQKPSENELRVIIWLNYSMSNLSYHCVLTHKRMGHIFYQTIILIVTFVDASNFVELLCSISHSSTKPKRRKKKGRFSYPLSLFTSYQ